MQKPIYLDYMATTPIDERVAAKMNEYMTRTGCFGNASSTNSYGRQASIAVEQARKQVAQLINAPANSLIWTSGATEAINLALRGLG